MASPASGRSPERGRVCIGTDLHRHADQVGLQLHEEAVRSRPTIGAQHARSDRQDVDDVGHLMGHPFKRRTHDLRAGGAARDAGDQATRLRVPVW